MAKKSSWLLLLSIGLNLLYVPSVGADFNLEAAAGYLKSQPADEWSVMALASANRLSGVSLEFLKSDPGSKPTDIEKRILAITAAGQSPRTFGATDLVQRLKTFFNGTEIDSAASPNMLNDDIFGLLALSSAGAEPDTQNQLAAFIEQNQNADGGWSFTKSPGTSDSNDTAMAIMALVKAGENTSSNVINSAFSYLAATKSGSGYSYDAVSGFGPDTASTAWVVSAQIAGGRGMDNMAQNFLQGQQAASGGFAWQTGSASPLMTAYALIALNNKFYPIQGTSGSVSGAPGSAGQEGSGSPAQTGSQFNPGQFSVAVIGPSGVLFQNGLNFGALQVTATNGQSYAFPNPRALTAATTAASNGGFSYTLESTSLGLYLSSLAGVSASGTQGWMYAVNGAKPSVGAADYQLTGGDKIIWFYGGPNDPVPQISWTADNSAGSNSTLASVGMIVNIQALEQNFSQPSASVNLTISKNNIRLGEAVELAWNSTNASFVVNSLPNNWAGTAVNGKISLQPAVNTTYTITVSGSGGTSTAAVAVSVDTAPAIVFGVDRASLNFGSLTAGQTSPITSVTISNSGPTRLRISSRIQTNSDPLYSQGLLLNSVAWSNFSTSLPANNSQWVNINLKVPPTYLGSGQKTGTLIFMAAPQ